MSIDKVASQFNGIVRRETDSTGSYSPPISVLFWPGDFKDLADAYLAKDAELAEKDALLKSMAEALEQAVGFAESGEYTFTWKDEAEQLIARYEEQK